MIVPSLFGGMCNQMAQTMCAIAYSIRHKMPYEIPTKTSNLRWRHYKFGKVVYGDTDTNCFYKYKCHDILYEQRPYLINYQEIPYYENIVIDGHFQSWKYWLEYINPIKNLFDFPYQTHLLNTVSVHLRRNDYLSMADKLPPISNEYIQRAIECFIDFGYTKFLCFSDDLIYMKSMMPNLRFPDSTEIDFSEGETDIEDFIKMSSCGSHICANSSYSLLASYFNPSPNKKIICPEKWFGEGFGDMNWTDIYPPNCIVL